MILVGEGLVHSDLLTKPIDLNLLFTLLTTKKHYYGLYVAHALAALAEHFRHAESQGQVVNRFPSLLRTMAQMTSRMALVGFFRCEEVNGATFLYVRRQRTGRFWLVWYT